VKFCLISSWFLRNGITRTLNNIQSETWWIKITRCFSRYQYQHSCC